MESNSDNVSRCPVTRATHKHSVGAGDTKNHDWWRRRGAATRVDLIFGSNSELRAITEVYGSTDVLGAAISILPFQSIIRDGFHKTVK